MNRKFIFHTIGYILLIEAVLMILPLVVGLIYAEHAATVAFLISIVITAAAGGLLLLIRSEKREMFAREGFVIVGLSWILISLFGCLPFFISGAIPHFIDAFFETVSGFTTTGASILTDIETLDHAMLFWRSFTHWIGGMGVLVFVLLILPQGQGQSMHILRAESPGPSSSKLVPRTRDMARILYSIYIMMTIVMIILLFAGGIGFFDSVCTTFASAGTGGFANYNDSIAHFQSQYIETVILVFVLLFGVNFNLYFLILMRRAREAFKSSELYAYLGIFVFAMITVAINIRGQYEGFGQALRDAAFQSAAILTTTGFSTTNFGAWPDYAREVMLVLMLIGGCAGSTAGGIKVARLVLLGKVSLRQIRHMVHPRSVSTITVSKKTVDEDTLRNCSVFMIVYVIIAGISVLLISFQNFGFETNFSAMLACITNCGPGLGMVDASGNYAAFNGLSKLVLCFDMLAGRLEIFPILILFMPSLWVQHRKKIGKIGRVAR